MKLINLECLHCGADLLHLADETLKADLLHLAEKQEKIRRETVEEDNGITIYIAEQELLDDIVLTMTAEDPDFEDLERTQIAVSTYKTFQEALCIRGEREAYN